MYNTHICNTSSHHCRLVHCRGYTANSGCSLCTCDIENQTHLSNRIANPHHLFIMLYVVILLLKHTAFEHCCLVYCRSFMSNNICGCRLCTCNVEYITINLSDWSVNPVTYFHRIQISMHPLFYNFLQLF